MSDLSAIKKQTIDALNAKSAEISALNSKVTALITTVNTMNTQITTMNTTITNLAANLANAIKTHNTDLSDLLAAINSIPAPVVVPEIQIVPAVNPDGAAPAAVPPKAQGGGRR